MSYGRQNKKKGLVLAAYTKLTAQDFILNDTILTYNLKAIGRTTTFFNLFMKVKHKCESRINVKTFKPIEFMMDIKEGKYYKTDYVYYNDDTLLNNENVSDILST